MERARSLPLGLARVDCILALDMDLEVDTMAVAIVEVVVDCRMVPLVVVASDSLSSNAA